MWDKESEAEKILLREQISRTLFKKVKGVITPYTQIGYSTEGAFQSDCFQWAVNSYNDELSGFLAHIPNEGSTAGDAGKIKGAIRKSLGVLAGFPDIILILPKGKVAYCEFKLPKEFLTDTQCILHAKWIKRDTPVTMVRNFTEWRTWIEINVTIIRHFLA